MNKIMSALMDEKNAKLKPHNIIVDSKNNNKP